MSEISAEGIAIVRKAWTDARTKIEAATKQKEDKQVGGNPSVVKARILKIAIITLTFAIVRLIGAVPNKSHEDTSAPDISPEIFENVLDSFAETAETDI